MPAASAGLPAEIRDLPPATRWVYRELEEADGPLTYDDLETRTKLSTRCLRQAVSDLEEIGRATRRPIPSAPRSREIVLLDRDGEN